MAFSRTLRKPLIDGYRSVRSKLVTLENSPATSIPPNAAKTSFHREYLTSPGTGFLRRFLHRSATMADFLSLPVGERLRERLRVIDSSVVGDRNRLSTPAPFQAPVDPVAGDRFNGLSVNETKKLLRMYQVEKIKSKVREIPMSSVSYTEFVQICVNCCGDEDQSKEIAKVLDASGNVIVLGNIVFVRPEQVAKSMEALISRTIHHTNDPRKTELDRLEETKAVIDGKARAGVRAELYGGLGFLLVQTLGFMRLTFWELSWDVMEPICFFVTSIHFALAYGFFLRTSTEPSFQGYFQQRFRVKQERLMKTHNFDFQRYKELKKHFRPYDCDGVSSYGDGPVPAQL